MSRIIPDVQILDQDNGWQSALDGLMSCRIEGGMAAGASKPRVGRCELLWDNTSQVYSPDPAGGTSALLRARRRIRVTATSASQGSILQVQHDDAADGAYWSQVVMAAVGIGDAWSLTWDARAQFDSMANTDQVYLVTSAEAQTPVTYTYTNKWITYTLVFTATTNGTTIEPRFRPHFAGTGKNSAAVEYRNITLKKGAGANVLTNGDFASGSVTPWASADSGYPASSNALTVIRDYRILFNGKISRIEPAPFQRAGEKTCRVIAVDFVDELQRKKVTGLPLQKNRRGDQLVTTVLALMPANSVPTTLPGKSLDTGKQVFSKAFDGYTKDTTPYEVLTDCAVSEYGMWWVDPDGTVRWAARDYMPKRGATAAALALDGTDSSTAGLPFDMLIAQDAGVIVNKTVLTMHPRNTASTGVVLGQITSPITIPAGGSHTVTLTYRDPATQKICGGDNVVTPLVPTTDYLINERRDGSGPDYTTYAAFSMSIESVDASQITIKLNNTATGPLYALKLQVRGDAIVSYDPQTITYEDAAAVAADGESAWSKDLPFNDDDIFVTTLGQYLVNRLKNPYDAVEWVRVDWRTILAGVDILSIAPLDVLAISDVQAGLTTAAKHLVTHWNYQFTPLGADYLGSVTWGLERVDDSTYAMLDDAVLGKLDANNRLFI